MIIFGAVFNAKTHARDVESYNNVRENRRGYQE
jgi:hypothetical protein